MLLYVQAIFSIHARDGQTPSRSLPAVSCDLIFRLAGTNDDAVTSFRAISALAPAFGAGDRTRVVLAHVGPTTPKQFGAKHQTCPHLAFHVPPDSTLEMGAPEYGCSDSLPA